MFHQYLEWSSGPQKGIVVLRTVPDLGSSLTPVENSLRMKFLLAILRAVGPIDNKLRTLLGNGVKMTGLTIRDPTLIAASLCSTSVEALIYLPVLSSATSPLMSRHTEAASTPQEWHTGKPDAMAKLPITQPLWTGCRQRSRNGWSMPPSPVHGY